MPEPFNQPIKEPLMAVTNNRNKSNSSSNNNNGGYNKVRVEGYANMEHIFEDGYVGKYPKGMQVLESQLHNDFLYNLVEDAKETEDGVIEFTVMTKVKFVLNKANVEPTRGKRTYK